MRLGHRSGWRRHATLGRTRHWRALTPPFIAAKITAGWQADANKLKGVTDESCVGLVLFSTIQGIAALLTAGMITPEQLDELTTDAIANFLRGSRTAG